ncbi:CAP domain-containing protein [Candidatus Saccharibacteria bacterium]|nr:CAP domain-containing protein [Candidatus Saccharibacteria bacterium]
MILSITSCLYFYVKYSFSQIPNDPPPQVETNTSFDSKLPDFFEALRAELAEQAKRESAASTIQAEPPVAQTAPPATKCTSGGSEISIALSNDVLDLVNITRAANGLGILGCKDDLIPLAEVRAKETIALFSHTRPNGQQWYSLNTSLMNGENLAIGYGTAQTVFDAWMASPGHRENILRPEFKSMGVGYIFTNSITKVPAELCQDRNGNPNDQDTECNQVYHHHIAQIFSVTL